MSVIACHWKCYRHAALCLVTPYKLVFISGGNLEKTLKWNLNIYPPHHHHHCRRRLHSKALRYQRADKAGSHRPGQSPLGRPWQSFSTPCNRLKQLLTSPSLLSPAPLRLWHRFSQDGPGDGGLTNKHLMGFLRVSIHFNRGPGTPKWFPSALSAGSRVLASWWCNGCHPWCIGGFLYESCGNYRATLG